MFRNSLLALVLAPLLVACDETLAVPVTATPTSTVRPAVVTPSPTAVRATAVPTATPTVVATAARSAATPTPPPPPAPAPAAPAQPAPSSRAGCDPSYPTVCIPPAPPDLDCPQIPFRRFTVVGADPHRFDADRDGIGCE
jgi:hypothetical protein